MSKYSDHTDPKASAKSSSQPMLLLASNPDEPRCIADDVEAELFLDELGILGQLLEKVKCAPSHSAPWAVHLFFSDHPTHWIIANHLSGLRPPGDNGYIVSCIPKSRCTLGQLFAMEVPNVLKIFPNGIRCCEIRKT